MKKLFAIVTVLIVALALCVSSFATLDAMYANETNLQWNGPAPDPGLAARAKVNVEKGDKLYILGWAAVNGAVLEKVYWTVDGEEKECADVYRDRTELYTLGIVSDEAYGVHAGFGLDEGMMELLGADQLEAGEYMVEIIALFDDGTEVNVKNEFELIVGGQEVVAPKENNEPKTLVVELISDGNTPSVQITEEDDGSLLCETVDEDADAWVSILLDEIDTSIYTSFTITYEIEGELCANNIYGRDIEYNPAYTPTVGTWVPSLMQGFTERTVIISNDFGLLDDTSLNGLRIPCAKTGGSLRIYSIVFHNPNGVAYRDFDAEEGDALSFDKIYANDAEIADGNTAVIEKKKGIDGKDGSISTLSLYGWYGNANSETVAIGYSIDGNDIVFGDSFIETESAVTDLNANNRRFKITVPVGDLKDDGHTIWIHAKLANGDIVKLNRFDNRGTDSEKDREIYVIYNGPASPTPAPTEEPTPTPEASDPTAAPDTGDPTAAPETTAAPDTGKTTSSSKKSGCGSVIFGGAAVAVLAAAALVIKKKH